MKKRNVNTIAGGGGSPAEPASVLCAPCEWTTQNVRKQSQAVVSGCQFSGNYEQSIARRGKPRFDAQARAVASHAKGGSLLSRPTESGAIHLNPSEWTTNKAKALAGDWTTKKVNQSSLRATNGSVAIHRRSSRFHKEFAGFRSWTSTRLPRVLRTLAMTPRSSGFHKGLMGYRTTIWHYIGNIRALARHNCHPELADLHSAEANNPVNCLPRGDEIRIASRLSEQERSSISETLRAWSKSKTDSGSIQRHRKNATLVRFRLGGRNDKIEMTRVCGFTMAEILLSLTIIGVVAAITLPSLTGNINERTWNTQRKALYARFSQALALMPSLSGYGTYQLADEATSTSAQDTAAETFVTEGLSKVLKINNICDNTHLQDCGIVTSYTNMIGSINSWPTKLSELNNMFTGTFNDGPNGSGGSNYTNPQKDIDTFAAAFETQNGESITVYYNPYCQGDMGVVGWHYSQPQMCANFIYDLNGNKGPNTVGKDIGFITALYPSDPVVIAPMPLSTNAGYSEQPIAGKLCQKQDSESRLPNKEELAAMFYNKELIGITSSFYWSGSVISSNSAWALGFSTGQWRPQARTGYGGNSILCVKR